MAAAKRWDDLTFSDIKIAPLSADAAIVLGRLATRSPERQAAWHLHPPLSPHPAGWRIVHDHTS